VRQIDRGNQLNTFPARRVTVDPCIDTASTVRSRLGQRYSPSASAEQPAPRSSFGAAHAATQAARLPPVTAGRPASPISVRHSASHVDRHHLEANLPFSAAWISPLEAHGPLVEVLVEALSNGGMVTSCWSWRAICGRSGRSDQMQQCINIRSAACLPSGSRDCQRCEEFLITARRPADLYGCIIGRLGRPCRTRMGIMWPEGRS
jgi:hypothetical protein